MPEMVKISNADKIRAVLEKNRDKFQFILRTQDEVNHFIQSAVNVVNLHPNSRLRRSVDEMRSV